MKSLLKRIIGSPDAEPVEEQPKRFSARVALQQEIVNEPRSGVRLIDEDTGYDPYDTGRFGAGKG